MATSVFEAYRNELNFKHLNAFQFQEIDRYSKNDMRFYKTPYGDMPSMTTVLGIRENAALDRWEERVGAEEAERIRDDAAGRGDILHNMCEHFLYNRTDYALRAKAEERHEILFHRMIPALCRIDNIVGLEVALYTLKYFMAGMVDCIGCFDGIPSIIDFKGSSKYKSQAWIKNYYLQETGYSLMFEEMTGGRWPIKQIVTLISCEESPTCQIIIKNRDDYVDEFYETQQKFFTKHPSLLCDTNGNMLH